MHSLWIPACIRYSLNFFLLCKMINTLHCVDYLPIQTDNSNNPQHLFFAWIFLKGDDGEYNWWSDSLILNSLSIQIQKKIIIYQMINLLNQNQIFKNFWPPQKLVENLSFWVIHFYHKISTNFPFRWKCRMMIFFFIWFMYFYNGQWS